ncbi:TetR/AcrR family transcriptional regulator [Pseudooceanicola sp. LIPI14-2-Ac024]|uniref:TetR/AcrR family transcriptional regulator n=1 Tax=Pseudooceanicola sp. LIPI14-2-Ac024 TaxID=3344875 RepID=UPI0035D10771
MTENAPSPTETAPRPGRPPALSEGARRRALIAAARTVFLRDGYAGATMERIAAEAQMSKKTLYRFFPDKRAALEALLGTHDHRQPLAPYGHRPGDDPRDELRRSLGALMAFLLNPEQIALTRLIISEAPQVPDLATSFREIEIESVMTHVRDRFDRLKADGAIRADDPPALADMMTGSLLGARHILALATPGSPPPDTAAITARVDQVIAVFAGPLGLD